MSTTITPDETAGRAKQLQFSFDLLTDSDVGELIGVSTQTLAGWRSEKLGPTYTKLGKSVFYRRADVDHWIYFKRVLTSEGGTPAQKPAAPAKAA